MAFSIRWYILGGKGCPGIGSQKGLWQHSFWASRTAQGWEMKVWSFENRSCPNNLCGFLVRQWANFFRVVLATDRDEMECVVERCWGFLSRVTNSLIPLESGNTLTLKYVSETMRLHRQWVSVLFNSYREPIIWSLNRGLAATLSWRGKTDSLRPYLHFSLSRIRISLHIKQQQSTNFILEDFDLPRRECFLLCHWAFVSLGQRSSMSWIAI